MSEPLLLALDTSTRTASLALFDGERVLSETTWLAGREHSMRLLMEAELALERVGKAREELTGLVVARGPGSFTGVRVALSVAKGMAAGLGIPAWGVSSLDALALAVQPTELPVCAVLEAGRGRFAVRRGTAQPRLVTVTELDELIAQPTVVIGELTTDARAQLQANPYVRLASVAAGARRAGFLAELGWRLAIAGDPGDPAALDAIYIG